VQQWIVILCCTEYQPHKPLHFPAYRIMLYIFASDWCVFASWRSIFASWRSTFASWSNTFASRHSTYASRHSTYASRHSIYASRHSIYGSRHSIYGSCRGIYGSQAVESHHGGDIRTTGMFDYNRRNYLITRSIFSFSSFHCTSPCPPLPVDLHKSRYPVIQQLPLMPKHHQAARPR